MIEIPPLLRIPPFLRSRPAPLAERRRLAARALRDQQVDGLIALFARERVGGSYWGSQPPLPAPGYVLVATKNAEASARLSLEFLGQKPIYAPDAKLVCDPWHLISGASEVIVDANDELALIAAIGGRPVRCMGDGPFARVATPTGLKDGIATHVLGFAYISPFTGETLSAIEAVELSAFWRKQIDANRTISGVLGVATWKRETVAAMLWAGPGTPRFGSGGTEVRKAEQVVIWRSKSSAKAIAEAERSGAELVEMEDGFFR